MNSISKALNVAHDSFRAQLWPIPVLGVVLAVAAGILVPHLDALVDDQLPTFLDGIVFNGDPEASRTILGAVASSLITVTSLTFSLTVVTLQLASSQFSPRLLRTFTQDLFVQLTLALFLATFTYSLTVLQSVRSVSAGNVPFAPRLAVTVSFLLAVASVFGLILFLAHLTRQIRVETMLRNVHVNTTTTIGTSLKRRDGDAPSTPSCPPHAEVVFTVDPGFLHWVNQTQLLDLARQFDVVISIHREPGDFLVTGTPLAYIWHRDGRKELDRDSVEVLRQGVATSVHIGTERTTAQDVGYGLRQLTDVASKALSPGINDPTTAVHALGHAASLLVALTAYELGPATFCDEEDIARVVLKRPTFSDYLELATAQPRRYGASDPGVVTSLYRLLEDLAWNSPVEHRPAVASQLRRLGGSVAAEDYDAAERARFETLNRDILQVLRRPLPAPSVAAANPLE